MFNFSNSIFSLFALAWFVASGFVFIDRANVLSSAQSLEAMVAECDEKLSRRRAQTSRGGGVVRSIYAPVAVSAEGYKVTGKIYLSQRDHCTRMIGKQVKIFVDADNPDEARINSFIQFWMFPVALAFAGAMIVAVIFTSKITFFILFVGGTLVMAGSVAHELRGVGNAADVAPIIVNSDDAWEVCLTEARREERVDHNDQLKKLVCRGRGVTDLKPLSGLSQLEYLDITGNEITSLSEISHLHALRELKLDGNRSLTSLDGLASLTALEVISARSVQLDNIDALVHVASLKRVDLNNNGLSDISALSALSNLEVVNLDDNRELVDISPLVNKPHLTTVTLYRTQVADLSALYESPKLRRVNIGKTPPVPCEQIEYLQQSRKQAIRGLSAVERCNQTT